MVYFLGLKNGRVYVHYISEKKSPDGYLFSCILIQIGCSLALSLQINKKWRKN